MTERTPHRAFSTCGGLARVIPSWNTLEIQREVYTDAQAFTEFVLFGQFEEDRHGHLRLCGYAQGLRWLERDTRAALIALITGQKDVAEVKETLVANELACERIYQACYRFVEVVDQYSVQAETEEYAADASSDDLLHHQSELAARMVVNRGTASSELYDKLTVLEDKFGTMLIPRFAGLLALNIPLVDSQAAPMTRADTIADLDIEARFDHIFMFLMDHIDANPALSAGSDEDRVKQTLARIYDELTSELSIEVGFPVTDPGAFPLLNVPRRRAPSVPDILHESWSRIQTAQREGRLPADPAIEQIANILNGFLDSFGCLIVNTNRARWYVPNHFVLKEEIGSDTRPGLRLDPLYYGQELFATVVTSNVTDQLIEQSTKNRAIGLPCPICITDHDLLREPCETHKVLRKAAKPMSHPVQWTDDLQRLDAVLEDFVAVDVPGEDQLTDCRNQRINSS